MDDLEEMLKRFGWLGLAGVALLGFGGIAGILILLLAFARYVEFANPGGEETKPIPDTDDKIVLPVFDKRLDPLRAEWDTYGRFEEWSALLPLARLSEVAYSDEYSVEQEFRRNGLDIGLKIDSPFHTQVAYLGYSEDVAARMVSLRLSRGA